MRSVARVFAAAIATVALAVASARADDAAEGANPHQHCLGLCAQYYGTDAEKRALCESGCSAARDCTDRCAARFSDNEDRRARCTSRCARPRGG